MISITKKSIFHIITLIVVIIWGTSFASVKTLLDAGMDTTNMLFVTFLIAYLSALAFSYKKIWSDNLKDEFIHLLCGLTGGIGFYFFQSEGLKYTYTTNISILVSFAPILTAIILFLFFKEKFNRKMLIGSVIALMGAIVVIFNGKIQLDKAPFGNFLGLMGALCWAFYNVLLGNLGEKYPITFTIRKVFFYGILTLLIYSIFSPMNIDLELFSKPVVIANLFYLGLANSMLCYVLWGYAIKTIGTITTANYMYLMPFATLLAGYFILAEPITIVSILGLLLIISGVYICEKKIVIFIKYR